MAIDHVRLARKLVAADAPPAWLREREEWQAVRAIVAGWLETSSIIADDSSASGFSQVDKAEPAESTLASDVVATAEALTPALRLAVFTLMESAPPKRFTVVIRSALLKRRLIVDGNPPVLSEFGRRVGEHLEAGRP